MKVDYILQGDCLEKLKELPDKSVDCCITSPPYYGLRDYGTGKWIGGNPDCPHRRLSKQSERTVTGHAQPELKGNEGDAIYKTVCPLCGAVREDKQIGLEETPEEYIAKLTDVFREVRRVLKDDGTLWVNIGDSYNGSGKGGNANGKVHSSVYESKQGTNVGSVCGTTTKKVIDGCKPKDLIGIPWMLAFSLRNDGWFLRQDIIWHKPNPMPESVKDRCVKSHEYIFLFSKKQHYYFDHKAIQEEAKWKNDKRKTQGRIAYEGKRTSVEGTKAQQAFVKISDKRNKRDVWSVPVKAIKDAHFATFPEKLIEPCILSGCREGGIVLDPFFGSGTTGRVAQRLGRQYIGIELNAEYIGIAEQRNSDIQLSMAGILCSEM